MVHRYTQVQIHILCSEATLGWNILCIYTILLMLCNMRAVLFVPVICSGMSTTIYGGVWSGGKNLT